MCCFTSASHLIHNSTSHISYPHRLLCGGIGQVCKCRLSPSSTSVYGLFSVYAYACMLHITTLFRITYTDLPRQELEPPLSYMPINIWRRLVGYVMLDSQTTEILCRDLVPMVQESPRLYCFIV